MKFTTILALTAAVQAVKVDKKHLKKGDTLVQTMLKLKTRDETKEDAKAAAKFEFDHFPWHYDNYYQYDAYSKFNASGDHYPWHLDPDWYDAYAFDAKIYDPYSWDVYAWDPKNWDSVKDPYNWDTYEFSKGAWAK